MVKINKDLKEQCMNEDFDVLHKIVQAYNVDFSGIKDWSEKDTKEFLDVNDKLFWSWYSCIIETKIKYKLIKKMLKCQKK